MKLIQKSRCRDRYNDYNLFVKNSDLFFKDVGKYFKTGDVIQVTMSEDFERFREKTCECEIVLRRDSHSRLVCGFYLLNDFFDGSRPDYRSKRNWRYSRIFEFDNLYEIASLSGGGKKMTIKDIYHLNG